MKPESLTTSDIVEVFVSIRPKIEGIIARRVGDAAVAADLVQDLYLRIERVSPRLASDSEAQRYLMKMAVNAAIDHQRVEGRRVELLSGVVDLLDRPERSPEDELLTDDQIGIVDRALNELPAKCREILFLSRVEGMTNQEVAERMGVSRVLVEKYVARAMLHCRARLMAQEYLGDDGVSP